MKALLYRDLIEDRYQLDFLATTRNPQNELQAFLEYIVQDHPLPPEVTAENLIGFWSDDAIATKDLYQAELRSNGKFTAVWQSVRQLTGEMDTWIHLLSAYPSGKSFLLTLTSVEPNGWRVTLRSRSFEELERYWQRFKSKGYEADIVGAESSATVS